MSREAEVVRDALAGATGAPFEIVEPGPNRLFLQEKAVWFVACLDLAFVEQTAYLDRAWKDREGPIWFETSEITDMTRLVESFYGEKGVAKMPSAEVGVPPSQGIPKEVAGFPRLVALLKKYERVVSEVAKRHGTDLRLLYDGGAGITTVRIAATTSIDENNITATLEVVDIVSKTLREAYNAVLDTKPTQLSGESDRTARLLELLQTKPGGQTGLESVPGNPVIM